MEFSHAAYVLLSRGAGKGESKKPPANGGLSFSLFALPNAYEVSCRARAWKCPIPGYFPGNTPQILGPPYPFFEWISAAI